MTVKLASLSNNHNITNFYRPDVAARDGDQDLEHIVSRSSGASEQEIRIAARSSLVAIRSYTAEIHAAKVEHALEHARQRGARNNGDEKAAVKDAFLRKCTPAQRGAYVFLRGLPPGVTHDEAGTKPTTCVTCGAELPGKPAAKGAKACPTCGQAMAAAAPAPARSSTSARAEAISIARGAAVPVSDERTRMHAAARASARTLNALAGQPLDVKQAAYNEALAIVNERFGLGAYALQAMTAAGRAAAAPVNARRAAANAAATSRIVNGPVTRTRLG